MALTAEGTELTRAHGGEQISLAVRAAAEATTLWADLNLADPMPWAYSMALVLEDRKRQSERLAAAYLGEFGWVESGSPIDVEREPINLDRLIGVTVATGVRPAEAAAVGTPAATGAILTAAEVRDRFAEIVAAETQRTYRDMVANTAKRNRVAWRRVLGSSNPCAFCAMLASRGPVYTDSTVTLRQDGLRYHKGCKCTAEPWFGKWSDWQPTEAEQPYVDAYFEAALQADAADEARVAPVTIRDEGGRVIGRTEDNILWRMRRNRPDLFSDGVHTGA